MDLSGKRILITGGLGMIGSSLASRLVARGAVVTLADAMLKPLGANYFNIAGIANKVSVIVADIRDKAAMKEVVKEKDLVYNLAAQVSHNSSIANPFADAEINYLGHLNVLEAVKENSPDAIIFFPGSRLQFGAIEKTPVAEEHPLRPMTPYALNKTAAEGLYQFYARVHGMRSVVFRIANPYGPRAQMAHSGYCIVNWFIRMALENKPITIFGDGMQIRDYIYIEDLVDAFMAASTNEHAWGGVFNLGSGTGTRFRDMAQEVVSIVGQGSVRFVPWPDQYLNVETGDYVSDITKISTLTGWRPVTSIHQGIELTVEYYRLHGHHYWTS